jgi:hypothetical protein
MKIIFVNILFNKLHLTLYCLLLFLNLGYSQIDSIPVNNKTSKQKIDFKSSHSPRKAILYGIFIPGGGQIYNRKYWKLPIVYGGIAGLTYLSIKNGSEYQCYRKSYLSEVDADPTTVNTCDPALNTSQLKLLRDNYRRSYEYSILGLVGFYALTVVDAFVDAHLLNFDIGDDLTLSVRPNFKFNNANLLQNSAVSENDYSWNLQRINNFTTESFKVGNWTAGMGLRLRINQRPTYQNKDFF